MDLWNKTEMKGPNFSATHILTLQINLCCQNIESENLIFRMYGHDGARPEPSLYRHDCAYDLYLRQQYFRVGRESGRTPFNFCVKSALIS